VNEAEVHCLLGPNGAGKSTADQVRLGAIEPTSGEILFLGRAASAGRSGGSLKRGVATIYQELDLGRRTSAVAESIFLAHEARRGPLADLDAMYAESGRAARAPSGIDAIPVRAKDRHALARQAQADRFPIARGRSRATYGCLDHGRAVAILDEG
jgi:ribose transport system ATP-binding protein